VLLSWIILLLFGVFFEFVQPQVSDRACLPPVSLFGWVVNPVLAAFFGDNYASNGENRSYKK